MNTRTRPLVLLPGLVAVILLVSGCQLPTIYTGGEANMSIRIDVPGPAIGAAPVAALNRYLSVASGRVSVQIARQDTGVLVFSQDAVIQAGSDGKAQAQLRATGIPLGVALSLTARVRDPAGDTYLLAAAQFTPQQNVDLDLSVTLAPDLSYPGLVDLDTQVGSILLPARGARILSRTIQADLAARPMFLDWGAAGSQLVCAALTGQGQDLTQTALSGSRGIEFTPAAAGVLYFLVVNTANADLNLALPSIGRVYTVTFDSQGGSAVASVAVQSGGLVTEPTAPTQAGYTFGGWYTDAACTAGNEWNFATGTITADRTLYAKWAPDDPVIPNYTVTFDSQGGSAVASVTVQSGGLVTEPTAPTQTGYLFGGWYTDAACTAGNEWNFATGTITADRTLYAKWTPDDPVIPNYTVTFDSQGGSAVASVTVQSGGLVTEPTVPTQAGYTFGGWYTDAACTAGNEWNFATGTITADRTLYAKWTSTGSITISLANPTDPNVTFSGNTPTLNKAVPESITVTVSDSTYTTWKWTVAGVGTLPVLSGDTTATVTISTSAATTTGVHSITLFFGNGSLQYSKRFTILVVEE